MMYGQNYDRRDSGRLPKPAVPPEFQDRMRPRGRDHQGSGWHQGAIYPDSRQQGYGQSQPFFQQQPSFKPPQPTRRRQSWPAQHKILTGLLAFAGLITITYEVTGSPADVTYGAAGSSLGGTVPMKVTAKLGDPIYYSLTAQLQGGGSVTVKILIDGTLISQGSAAGGYNIASAEISQDPLSGQWVDTNNG